MNQKHEPLIQLAYCNLIMTQPCLHQCMQWFLRGYLRYMNENVKLTNPHQTVHETAGFFRVNRKKEPCCWARHRHKHIFPINTSKLLKIFSALNFCSHTYTFSNKSTQTLLLHKCLYWVSCADYTQTHTNTHIHTHMLQMTSQSALAVLGLRSLVNKS